MGYLCSARHGASPLTKATAKPLKLCPGCKNQIRAALWEEHVIKCPKVMGSMLPARIREKRIKRLLGSEPEFSKGDFKAPTETQAIGAFGLGKSRKH